MLVLLIIFMVTAPLMTSGVQVDLPESKAEALAQEQDPVSVTIDPAGTIYVNDEPVASEALGDSAARIKADRAKKAVRACTCAPTRRSITALSWVSWVSSTEPGCAASPWSASRQGGGR
jgi:biopolymer transport protein TolR